MDKILSASKITKTYATKGQEQRQRVLDEVSLDIYEGEFVAIMGASGSGKSTLLYALSKMDNMDSGEIIFDEQNLSGLTENQLADVRRHKMGFVFQQPTLLKNLNIIDNIILPQMKNGKKKRQELTQMARTLMAQVGIENFENRDITQVSGGQLQRAGICRALMSNPKIIFADEPTGALNSKSSEEIMEVFGEINKKGTAILVVTHDMKVASKAQRVLFMQDGKIVDNLEFEEDDKTIEKRLEQILLKTKELEI